MPIRPTLVPLWYFPSASGDIRFEGDENQTCITVEDPTLPEINLLKAYLAGIQRVHPTWGANPADVVETGKSTLLLKGPLSLSSRLFMGSQAPPRGVILGVRYSDGKITATLDGPSEGLHLLDPSLLPSRQEDKLDMVEKTETPEEKVERELKEAGIKDTDVIEKEAKKDLPAKGKKTLKGEAVKDEPKKVEKAVVVQRPTQCCPLPEQGPQDRASEVLHAFTTPEQWDEWTRDGMIHCKGNLTGDTFRVVHRKHPLAERQGKAAYNETRKGVVHCHATHLPAPEEALSILLTLQFGEDYLINPSGWFQGGIVFDHPLGLGASDGLGSTGMLQGAASPSFIKGMLAGVVLKKAFQGS